VANLTVGAVILAAGAGERLGGPKLRLESGGRPFLDCVLAAVTGAGCAPVVCVVRAEDREWSAGRLEPAGGAVVVNPEPERGALSSLRLGLDRLDSCAGALVAAVDHPFVTAATCRALAAAFTARPDAVVKPVWDGRSGHPVVIPRELFARVPREDRAGGLAEVIRGSGLREILLPVDDPGVCRNINFPADLDESLV
jgi:CTP:molybdopterin cytidylyltransferase MocA